MRGDVRLFREIRHRRIDGDMDGRGSMEENV